VEVVLDVLPPEIVPFARRGSGRGPLVCREHAATSGARLRLRGVRDQLVVRSDAGPLRLDEIVLR
jgi:hypothetical protein